MPELVEPELSLGAVEAWRLAAVATGLCGADAFFRGDHEHGAVYLLLHDTPLAGPLRSPAERVVAILRGLLGHDASEVADAWRQSVHAALGGPVEDHIRELARRHTGNGSP